MDNLLTTNEEKRFDAWVHSPTVFSSNRDELIIAYKLGKLMQFPASRVLKALRGREGLDPKMLKQVEDFVAGEQSLAFTGDPPARLVVLTDA